MRRSARLAQDILLIQSHIAEKQLLRVCNNKTNKKNRLPMATNLEDARVRIDEKILRFNIAMTRSNTMNIGERAKQLE